MGRGSLVRGGERIQLYRPDMHINVLDKISSA